MGNQQPSYATKNKNDLLEHKDFRLKIRLEGYHDGKKRLPIDGCSNPPDLTFDALFIGMIRRIQLCDLKELTYEALTKEILTLAAGSGEEQPPPPIGKDDLRLTYTDVDGHIVTIGSTKEFVYAIQDSLNQGHALITASPSKKEAKIPPPPALTAPTITTDATAVKVEQPEDVPTSIPVTPDSKAAPSRKRKKAATGDNARKKKTSKKKLESDATEGGATAAIRPKLESDVTEGDVTAAIRPVSAVADNAAATTPAQLLNDTTTTRSSFDPRSVHGKICSALMELRALSIPQPPRVQVALFAGYSNVKSAGFAKALSHLKKEGFVEFPNKKSLRLGASCIDKLPAVQAPVDNTAVQARLRVMLRGKKGKVGSSKTDQIFEELTDGLAHTREAVAMTTGYTNLKSAGFAKALGTLSGLGMITYPDRSSLMLTDISFPYGRPAAVPDAADDSFIPARADVVTPDHTNSI
jgi:hypothetical protein